MITLAEIIEHYQVVRQTFAPLRLSRWQLMKLLAAQVWREASSAAKTIIIATSVLLLLSIIARITRPRSLRRLGIPPAVKSKSGRLNFKQILEDTAKRVRQARASAISLLYAPGSDFAAGPKRPVLSQRLWNRICRPAIQVLR